MDSQLQHEFLRRMHLRSPEIHCVGDAMVDIYHDVDIDRISPEHPVPVMKSEGDPVRLPGGAANVAYQFKHLNANIRLICYADTDAMVLYSKLGIPIRAAFPEDMQVPLKTRFLSGGKQITARLDQEKPSYGLAQEELDMFSEHLMELMARDPLPEVAVLSDYDKGLFASEKMRPFDLYREKTITIVDPKKGPFEKWEGCTIFKPNAKEAKELTGYSDWRVQVEFLQNRLGCQAVVITQGSNGIVGLDRNEIFEYRPVDRGPARNVTGAGDCFAAFFATGVAHGFSVKESAQIACEAATAYVHQDMGIPLSPADLCLDKIVRPWDLRRRGFRLVFTNGCFDVLHQGHLETLKFAKSKGERLVVAVNSDESVRRLKGQGRPVVPLQHRMAVLAALEYVDYVTCFEEETPLEALLACRPEVLVKGGDYDAEDILGRDFVEEVHLAPLVPNAHSSDFIARSKET